MYIHQKILLSNKSFTQDFRTENMLSFKKACHEMDRKGLLYLVLLD